METKPIVISNQLNGGQFFFGASDARRGVKKKDRVLQKNRAVPPSDRARFAYRLGGRGAEFLSVRKPTVNKPLEFQHLLITA